MNDRVCAHAYTVECEWMLAQAQIEAAIKRPWPYVPCCISPTCVCFRNELLVGYPQLVLFGPNIVVQEHTRAHQHALSHALSQLTKWFPLTAPCNAAQHAHASASADNCTHTLPSSRRRAAVHVRPSPKKSVRISVWTTPLSSPRRSNQACVTAATARPSQLLIMQSRPE